MRARGAVEHVAGRNPVVEALRAGVPARRLDVAESPTGDRRVEEIVRLAGAAGVAVRRVPRADLDRQAPGAVHQGVLLAVAPYRYADLDDLVAHQGPAAFLVALDGVTDPHNLGAVVRSAAAFGAQGVVVPERRSAGMTPAAWKASAGAAARLPLARVTNLTRALGTLRERGLAVVGLDADAVAVLDELDVAADPLVLVAGGEERGLSRLVAETCTHRVRIPIASGVESLNVSVAVGVALSEVARRRRVTAAPGGGSPDR